jgi:ABC-type branched-subunit amino acid transport system substrate-binding protein
MQVKAIVSYAIHKLKLKNFAILYPEEDYGSFFMNLFWDEVAANGGRIVGVESYDVSQTDFTDPVKKLVGLYYDVPRPKRNPEKDEPEPIIDFEAVFIPDAPNKAALIMPQLAYYDVENVYVFGTNLWHSQKLIETAERYVQGAIMVDGFFVKSEDKEVKDFVSAFEATYGGKPDFIEAVSYDTAMMLFKLISRPDISSRSELMVALKKLRDYKGVTGLTSFEETGDVKKDFYMLKVKGQEFVQIED